MDRWTWVGAHFLLRDAEPDFLQEVSLDFFHYPPPRDFTTQEERTGQSWRSFFGQA